MLDCENDLNNADFDCLTTRKLSANSPFLFRLIMSDFLLRHSRLINSYSGDCAAVSRLEVHVNQLAVTKHTPHCHPIPDQSGLEQSS